MDCIKNNNNDIMIEIEFDFFELKELCLKVINKTLKEAFKEVEGFETYYNLESGITYVYSNTNINLDMESVKIVLVKLFNEKFNANTDLFKYNIDLDLEYKSNDCFYKYVFYLHLF